MQTKHELIDLKKPGESFNSLLNRLMLDKNVSIDDKRFTVKNVLVSSGKAYITLPNSFIGRFVLVSILGDVKILNECVIKRVSGTGSSGGGVHLPIGWVGRRVLVFCLTNDIYEI